MSYEERVYLIENDPHSLPEHRVDETLKNMPEFAEAFECPLGSSMNPKNKCMIW
jgi:endothelin-converting enzyme